MPKRLNGRYRQDSLLLKNDGEDEFEISNYQGLHFARLTVSSPQPQTNFKTNTGIDGQIQQGPIIYASRTAKADFWIEVSDGTDLESRFHEFYNKFFNRGLVRVRQSYDIGRCFYGIPKPFSYTDIGFYDKSFQWSLKYQVLICTRSLDQQIFQ
ncbi:phage tail domain-containing protein [Companilactobacillus nodensis]|uniref:phage tail domain-containing protein n=1 Tax=Companilactobacillus nodensis TaxID=460870 RepID=UPI00046ACAA2|nr:phage tail domain-containing protein [Companilactobacillus nodensis]